ncbi:probable bifunctional methylthioribulose-1-phosphate dehydratase/enolase-phosphatase E1 [Physcomitrium patens]|uniref:Enolase-phosphatase E1 n=1 Tax=Physcomitrium patens TaxID=3218 RepID=A0A2K1KQC2_PHYPA|nr:probable bifunctional methylthioribulose-1-phosphate dehydratase/enolase-phosphatase E1 [Physcomitrium patens]PNR55984.1 hypothetical protein PHYPA_006881 [Physcomitrium patens]|eukprot:XP_024374296.1 probable bifunctional methylthioribulose-1-phosphate dehydratase/enolase-phosphatase E1 [Physcomitrella patens]
MAAVLQNASSSSPSSLILSVASSWSDRNWSLSRHRRGAWVGCRRVGSARAGLGWRGCEEMSVGMDMGGDEYWGWVSGTGKRISLKKKPEPRIDVQARVVAMALSDSTISECYRYLFGASFQLPELRSGPVNPKHGPLTTTHALSTESSEEPSSKKVVVLDIEGTTTPISCVTEVLFPYARDNVGSFLRSTYDTTETRTDIQLLRDQVHEDLMNGVPGAKEIPVESAGIEAVIAAVEENVQAMIKADRKVTALKELQGHIWRVGYEKGELKGVVFEDVPEALADWDARGIKAYIYSSGSREAQKHIFGNTNFGDLRVYLSGFFDTTIGNKRESRSYKEIYLTVGVDHPSCITFATDVLAEAIAAKEAGLQAVLLLRPGNAPLPPDHGFRTIKSLHEL